MAAVVSSGCPLCSVRLSTANVASPQSNVSSSRQTAVVPRANLNSSFQGQALTSQTLQRTFGVEKKMSTSLSRKFRSLPSSANVARAALGDGGLKIATRGFDVSKPKMVRLAPEVEERLNGGRERVVCLSRRKNAEKRPGKPDPVYRNRLVNLIVNRIMKNGKKSLAYRILYRALKSIKNKTQKNPLLVLRQAVRRATPKVAVKARRVGGSTYQVPIEIKTSQGKALAIRWLLAAARKRPGRTMAMKLSLELLDAARDTGMAIKKREETHRMAEANRAFASFAPR